MKADDLAREGCVLKADEIAAQGHVPGAEANAAAGGRSDADEGAGASERRYEGGALPGMEGVDVEEQKRILRDIQISQMLRKASSGDKACADVCTEDLRGGAGRAGSAKPGLAGEGGGRPGMQTQATAPQAAGRGRGRGRNGGRGASGKHQGGKQLDITSMFAKKQ